VPLTCGQLGPRLTQCGLGRSLLPYRLASSSIQPFGHNRCGPKIRGLCPLFEEGELDPHLTQVGAEAYLYTKWHLNPSSRLATTDMGQKLGAVPLWRRGSWVPM